MNGPRRIGIGVLFVVTLAVALPHAAAHAQSVSRLQAEELVGDAGARASEYFELFADLTATETKTVEEFRDSGEVSARRSIVADLIVYRSQVGPRSVAEYRDVTSVDGAPVAGREQRVLALFERGGHAESTKDELARVNREGSRYDLDHTVAGLTIGQALPVQASARAFFDFSVVGDDVVDGRRVVVLAYTQAVSNPRFGFDLSLPSELRRTPPLYRGRLWLDAETAQVWREVREVVVAPPTGSPVVVQRTEFTYGRSRFDVPLPKRIVFTALLRFSKNGGTIVSSPSYRITFSYGEFRRFTTTSDEGEVARVAPSEEPAAPAADAGLGPEFGPDAPLGPLEPPPAPRIGPTAERLGDSAPTSELPPSLRPPAFPVVAVAPPPPPPPPGQRFRVPPS